MTTAILIYALIGALYAGVVGPAYVTMWAMFLDHPDHRVREYAAEVMILACQASMSKATLVLQYVLRAVFWPYGVYKIAKNIMMLRHLSAASKQ